MTDGISDRDLLTRASISLDDALVSDFITRSQAECVESALADLREWKARQEDTND